MEHQRRKFMETFDLLVKNIADFDECIPMLEDLGRRHAAYGVEDRHYESVGKALLATLDTGLGQAVTPESRAAWAAAYKRLSEPMQRAARAVSED